MEDLKRRDFIKNTLMAGVGSSIGLPLIRPEEVAGKTNPESENNPRKPAVAKKIIVAGAGISGLCCAYELMKSGHEVLVLEASGRHGGHVFTGRDGLSDGLYADYGADHITRPGYEFFFEYTKELDLPVLPYRQGNDSLQMIGGKFYSEEMLADPAILKKFGFNEREVKELSLKPWWALQPLYLDSYIKKITDPYQPFGVGLDELDQLSLADLYKREGASPAALDHLGGKNTSALYKLWRLAVMGFRGIPLSEGETFRLKGGNQQITNAFAKHLGSRVKLGSPILAINQTDKGVTVTYKEFGYPEEKQLSADFLVNCISLPVFRNILVTPALSAQKQYVIDHLGYTSHPHYIFEASSRFWLEDGFKSINMEFEHPDISAVWQTADEVDTGRVVLVAFGPGGLSPQRVLAAFRKVYPGKRDSIVQALTKDWTKDNFAPTCEMVPFPVGEMHKFWPELMKPDGRIYFAGTYADNLSRGMESCLRSAKRVANEIDHI
ncbi:MAG TPA: NAD(P)/FAD-dependent oxidoreductase [Puia sp.]